MKKRLFSGLVFVIIGLAGSLLAEPMGDAEAGQKLFRQCASCHTIGDEAVNRVGPVLTDVFGGKIANVEGFRYSDVLTAAGQEDRVWDPETLDAFLANPRSYFPRNRMSFRGLRNEQDRANLIAYLGTFAGDSSGGVAEAGFSVAPEILAIEGDVEYGEYLASECKTCHQTSGTDDGIPNIVGLSTDDFATAMHAYREKFRENPVMQLVANRLSDDEIAALAAYFKDLED